MNHQRLKLEDFGAPQSGGAKVAQPQGDTGYEDGYRAGWDDAVAQEHNAAKRVAADLEKSLQDIAFTFYEARGQVLREISAMLEAVTGKLLPELAQAGFAQTLAGAVTAQIDTAGPQGVKLSVHPENLQKVQNLLPATQPVPVDVCSEPAVAPGQAFLSVGGVESIFDIDALTDQIQQEFNTYLNATHHEETQSYGHG